MDCGKRKSTRFGKNNSKEVAITLLEVRPDAALRDLRLRTRGKEGLVSDEAIHHELLAIDTEAICRKLESDGSVRVSAEQVYIQFCEQVLDIYLAALSGRCSGWVCVAGFLPGFLKAIASRSLSQGIIPKNITWETAHRISAGSTVKVLTPAEVGAVVEQSQHGDTVLRVNLVEFAQLYGMMFLHRSTPNLFDQSNFGVVQQSETTLNRLMSDESFCMRLTSIAAPLDIDSDEASHKNLYTVISERARLGLRADAAILRLRRDGRGGEFLQPLGVAGLAVDELLTPEGAGERIARLVLDSSEGITIQSFSPKGVRESIGTRISSEDDGAIRAFGFQAYMVMRLQSDLKVGDHASFGTLGILHASPQSFSRRDVGLFRSFCERIADDIALLEQRSENEAMLHILKAQDQLGTRAEITALLGHDFGHKVLSVETDLVDFVDACKKQMGERRLPEKLQIRSERLLQSTENLKQIVSQLRMLGQGLEETPALFSIVDEEKDGKTIRGVFREMSETLSGALERNTMSLAFKSEGNCRLFGVRSILVQALYNLVINSIDAQRYSGRRRKNTVSIQCREITGVSQGRVVEFKIWDEGPGISRTAFPDENRIFDVGTTSKAMGLGTGTGLPVARSLLGKYFGSDLQLRDRAKALFQFTIHIRAEQEKKQ